jgi:hypothetical protein
MAEACLGEEYARNGVIKAMTETIATALAEAVAGERKACAEIAATMGGPWMECDANGDGYQEAREHIATAIRSRGDVK